MDQPYGVSIENIFAELKKNPPFTLNEIFADESFIEISDIIKNFCVRINNFSLLQVASRKQAEFKSVDLEKKCTSLEVRLKESEQKQCLECSKLRKDLEFFKNRSDLMSNKTLFTDGSDSSSPNEKNRYTAVSHNISPENTIIPTKPFEGNVSSNSEPKTPIKTERETSPIVQKQSRSGKRKALFMSSKRRSQLDNQVEQKSNLPSCSKYQEIMLATETPENEEKSELEQCITPINDADLSDDNIIEPSPLPVGKNHRRVNSFLSEKKISEIENHDSDTAFNPLSVNLLENYKGFVQMEETKKNNPLKKQKTKWNLKKTRCLSDGKKLKQTLLSTTVFNMSVDISTLNEFKGGLASTDEKTSQTINEQDDMELTNLNNSSSEKENKPNIMEEQLDTSQETYFNPETHHFQHECEKTMFGSKVEKNSFDYPPSLHESPDYKHRRSTVRKKSERQQLPGQECKDCCNFYFPNKNKATESQLNLINKFSRHRDKYAINTNTPPGIWNPVFDTDDEAD